MLRVSRLADYATGLMACLGEMPDTVASAGQLAECMDLELPTVSKVLKLLARAGLLKSFRGANGGYRLARPAWEISVADVIEAIEGPISMTECSVAAGRCPREATCGVREHWQRINARVTRVLREMSVADMMRPPARSSDVPPPARRAAHN